jgi:hypothetical protein
MRKRGEASRTEFIVINQLPLWVCKTEKLNVVKEED